MIPNHKQFIEAINAKHKVCLRFYSIADSGVIDLVCAPLDYGPGVGVQDGVNRYWLWDYTSNTGSPTLGLLPEQVLDMRILGHVFDPAEFAAPPASLALPREQSTSAEASEGAPPNSAPTVVRPLSADGPRSRKADDSSPHEKPDSEQPLLASLVKPLGNESDLC